jgi:16S rRNA (cytosine967-C5)-methyltransferase
MKSDPRKIALDILVRWDQNRSITLDRCLDTYSDRISALSLNDRRLCNTIVFGTLRHRLYLDYVIDQFSSRPVSKIQVNVLYLLRMAVFQICFLDRIPDFAVLHTTVEMIKRSKDNKASGFVNAVLRKVTDNKENIRLPDQNSDLAGYISIRPCVA